MIRLQQTYCMQFSRMCEHDEAELLAYVDSVCADSTVLMLFHELRPAQWRVILEEDGRGRGEKNSCVPDSFHTHTHTEPGWSTIKLMRE